VTIGTLEARLSGYLELRRSLGYKTSVPEHALRDFVEYLGTQHPQQAPIRAETAVDWARQASAHCYRTGAAGRLWIVRGFLTYLKAFEPETEIPPTGLVAEPRRPKAHLYSPEQISRIMQAEGWFWEAGSFRQKTYSTLVGLLASTGLRVGEALRLTLAQAHLDEDPAYLEIRDTKFHKSRLVPLHPTTAAKLREYRSERTQHRCANVSQTLFINDYGRRLLYGRVWKAFFQAQRHVGLLKDQQRQGPALHALRHSFAVQRLLVWYRAGADVRAQMPHLSVYMGHLGMVETYHYLSATPELLTIASERFGRYAGAEEEL